MARTRWHAREGTSSMSSMRGTAAESQETLDALKREQSFLFQKKEKNSDEIDVAVVVVRSNLFILHVDGKRSYPIIDMISFAAKLRSTN